MTAQTLRQFIKALERDEDLRRSLALALAESIAKNEVLLTPIVSAISENAVLKEIEALRRHTDGRFEAVIQEMEVLRKQTDSRFEAVIQEIATLRQDIDKRFEAMDERFKAMDKRFEAMDKRFEALIDEMHHGFRAMDGRLEFLERTFGAIGQRWGDFTEEAFRNIMRGVLEKRFGVHIKKWIYNDKEGFVDGVPSTVEVDLKISNSEHILIEVKSSASKADVTHLYRVGKLYAKVVGVTPNLVLFTPFPGRGVMEKAAELGVEVYRGY